jgi:outer membrane protein assembly factor BamD (BamD/ComL family)
MLEFSDKAVFEAAAAYENAKMYTQAAETFMLMPRKYVKSSLTIKAIMRAAVAYKKDNKPRDAARTFLFITDNFAQDSTAYSAISWAAGVYDSSAIRSKNAADSSSFKKLAAQTYEIAYKKFPKHEKTPSLLYSACISYEEAKVAEEAIRCSKDLVRDYPKSSYALDAAFSIPMAYVAVKKWEIASTEFINFARMYTTNKEKLIAAYMGAARAFMELKNPAKAAEQYKNVLTNYDKFGIQIKNADPGIPAEAAFYLADFEFEKMAPFIIKGNEKEKGKTLKDLMTVLGTTMSMYAKSAQYASEKWTFKATNKMGMLFVTIAAKIREQQLTSKGEEEKFAERIGIVQQLPSYYEQARPIFEKNLILAREQGFYNEDVIAAEEGYVEMFYQDCAVFFEVSDAFKTAPLPDRKAIIAEYMDPNGDAMQKEDAEMATDEDLKAYKDELDNKAKAAAEGGLPKCATGIKASAHYQIDNKWTQKLFTLVKTADSTNEALSVKIAKFDPSTLFKDPSFFKTKARLDQIAASQVMTPEEQLATYRDILKEAKATNAKLKAELAELKTRLSSQGAPAPQP